MIAWFNRTMSMTMPIPGGWRMSMMWMEVASGSPGQLVVFIVMWVSMMVAMMLPSTLPMLLLYRRVARFRGDSYLSFRVWRVGAGLFCCVGWLWRRSLSGWRAGLSVNCRTRFSISSWDSTISDHLEAPA